MWRVSLTHPVLLSFLCREFLLHITCWLVVVVVLSGEFLLHIPCCCCCCFYRGSFSYKSRAGFIFIRGVSLTHLVPALILSGDFPGSYTSQAGFIFIGGVSLTHPVLVLFLCREFVGHILCCLHFYAGSFSYTSRAGFFFYMGSFSYTSHAGSIFFLIWGVSLTHPVLASVLFGEVLLKIPCCPYFYVGSFSYTSRVALIFIWEVCLSHPVLDSFFIRGVSLTLPLLASFLSQVFLLHIP